MVAPSGPRLGVGVVTGPSFFSSVFVPNKLGVLVVEVSAVEPAAGVEVTGAVGVLPNKPPPPNKLAPVPAVPAEVADASAAGCAMDPCVVVGALSADLRGSPVVCAGTVDAGVVPVVVP